ncbi:hypothetical protein OHS33_12880 [Streptomyces sp. NBC_00536]|uniref:hypothetical protein n=1 Tax=Streptomyces sp. NBC_00536 TaxID=2975769 RepID=UPI002E82007C|nr:hypothetical protein [Streptomyces sp. NBC_00536]WUC79155.1 hypothetical protein OHS33_12880 [Streptomyces sp. NBC_00536]
MPVDESQSGRGRVTVFRMFGAVFGYATHSLDERNLGEVAVVGPLTPGVEWGRLWEMARAMCRASEGESEHARWIMAQANRSFTCGGDVVVKFPRGDWKLARGKRADLGGYCHRDHLWTGAMTVEEATPEQVAAYASTYQAVTSPTRLSDKGVSP